jgi:hypothetical protein
MPFRMRCIPFSCSFIGAPLTRRARKPSRPSDDVNDDDDMANLEVQHRSERASARRAGGRPAKATMHPAATTILCSGKPKQHWICQRIPLRQSLSLRAAVQYAIQHLHASAARTILGESCYRG